ncbi:SAM-dependent methyltransferase, partial [Candidatus Poribacteria bacterium]|nr:SAM-dependent methyltransferase [Candidatus Poribacteria bacterium]
MQQSFYGRIRSEGYDIGTEQKSIIDFYLNLWQQADTPTPILEPMCGTGLNLIPFVEAGMDIDG